MDDIKRSLYAGMADDARRRRIARTKKKYELPPELDAIAQSQDEAVDAAQLPPTPVLDGMKEVNAMADQNAEENAAALAALDEDEEMQKWMAKQKG